MGRLTVASGMLVASIRPVAVPTVFAGSDSPISLLIHLAPCTGCVDYQEGEEVA